MATKTTTSRARKKPPSRKRRPKAETVATGDSFAFQPVNVLAEMGSADPFGDQSSQGRGPLKYVLRNLINGNTEDLLKRCASARDEDDLISAIINAKKTFFGAGFRVEARGPSGYLAKMVAALDLVTTVASKLAAIFSRNNRETATTAFSRLAKVNHELDQLNKQHALHQLVEEMISDWELYDNVVVQWKIGVTGEAPGLHYVTTLEPYRIKGFQGGWGQKEIKLELTADFIAMVMTALGVNKTPERTIAKLKADGVPEKYVKAVFSQTPVTLKNEDGEYWIIRANGPKYKGFAKPALHTIELDIKLRQFLLGGDFSVAFFFKRLIEIIHHGEGCQSGPLAGKRGATWTQNDDIAKLAAQFELPAETLRIITDHTLKIVYSQPPTDSLGGEKYDPVEKRILRWGDIPDIIMTGEGGTYAGGFIGVKKLVAKGVRTRRIVGEILVEFLSHPTVRPADLKDKDEIDVLFDQQNLKEPQQLLDEVNAAYDRGALSVTTYQEQLGFHHSMEAMRKVEEHRMGGLWRPLFEPRQGMLSLVTDGKEGGRPRSDTKPNPTPEKKRGDPKPS